MNNINHRQKLSFILVPLMVLYVFLPCIAQASSINDAPMQHVQAVPVYTPPANSKILTYYEQGSSIMDTADGNGYISSYLGRNIRTVIDTNNSSYQTNYLIKNGKDVIAKTQNGTTLSKTYQYTPYGKTVDLTNSSPQPPTPNTQSLTTNPFRYSSYYLDAESGLYYLNARYYSPELMRFISRDTYDLNNRYAYGNGNPIGNVDPTGHLSTNQWLGIAFTVLAVFSMRPLAVAAASSYLASTFTKGNLSKGLEYSSYALAGLEAAGDIGGGVYSAYKSTTRRAKTALLNKSSEEEFILRKNILQTQYEDGTKVEGEETTNSELSKHRSHTVQERTSHRDRFLKDLHNKNPNPATRNMLQSIGLGLQNPPVDNTIIDNIEGNLEGNLLKDLEEDLEEDLSNLQRAVNTELNGQSAEECSPLRPATETRRVHFTEMIQHESILAGSYTGGVYQEISRSRQIVMKMW